MAINGRLFASRALDGMERLYGGGQWSERILIALLRHHYRSAYRRVWLWPAAKPHFYPQRWAAFDMTYRGGGPYALSRGFYTAEVLRDGDRMLDIGCGDGFYVGRFYASRCSAIDAVDIDAAAIKTALRFSRHPRVTFWMLDAVREPFPSARYDVIAWDGAIGHFDPGVTESMLRKIRVGLADAGVFVGSEALGKVPDIDHLQTFLTVHELAALLRGHFPVVQVKEVSYKAGGEIRREGYWRCALNGERLRDMGWIADPVMLNTGE